MSETSRVVDLVLLPVPISVKDFAKECRAITKQHGRDVVLVQEFGRLLVRTPGPVCWCATCDERDRGALADLSGNFSDRFAPHMIVCPDCGNKRCPKANHHDNACTGSNEVGQPGSAYPATNWSPS